MDSRIIHQTSLKVLAGTVSFPEVVDTLTRAGVEYYRVDFVTLTKTYYGADGSVATTPLNFEALPPVAPVFDAAALKAALRDSQQNGQHYRDFSRRAMQAGVQTYTAFLRGQRVVYLGRQGDQHIEWFPDAEPAARAVAEKR